MANGHISKLDAARRQLETAIYLYFHDRDIVSVHTLAAAGILGAILGKNVQDYVAHHQNLLSRVRTEHRIEFLEKVRAAQNYFKHSDRDANKVVPFEAGSTEVLLLDGIFSYRAVTGDLPSIFKVFNQWIWLKHPNWLRDEEHKQPASVTVEQQLEGVSRSAYFEMALPLFNRMQRTPGQ